MIGSIIQHMIWAVFYVAIAGPRESASGPRHGSSFSGLFSIIYLEERTYAASCSCSRQIASRRISLAKSLSSAKFVAPLRFRLKSRGSPTDQRTLHIKTPCRKQWLKLLPCHLYEAMTQSRKAPRNFSDCVAPDAKFVRSRELEKLISFDFTSVKL